MSFCCAIINISTQSMQRNAAFTIAFAASDFSTAQTTANLNFNTFSAHAHGTANTLFHCTAESDTAFQLRCNVLCNQSCVHIRGFYLNDVDINYAVGHFFQVVFQQFNVAALTTDYHTRFSSMDRDAGSIRSAFDFYFRDTGQEQFFFNEFTNFNIF